MSWGLDKLPFDLLNSAKEGLRRFKTSRLEDEVSRGNVIGSESFSSYGRMITGGTVTNKIIWPDGVWSVPPIGGVTLSVVSTSASDGVNGTGIRSIEIHYLDINLNIQSANVILNGITPVVTTLTGVRFVQCTHMTSFGTAKSAVGNISIYSGANTYSYIGTGDMRCSSSARRVPKGKRWVITGAMGSSISGTAAAKTEIFMGSSVWDGHDYTEESVLMPMAALGFQDNSFGIVFSPYPVFPEGCVVGMLASTDKDATVSGTLFGYLEDTPL